LIGCNGRQDEFGGGGLFAKFEEGTELNKGSITALIDTSNI